jgi:hypothetical protein
VSTCQSENIIFLKDVIQEIAFKHRNDGGNIQSNKTKTKIGHNLYDISEYKQERMKPYMIFKATCLQICQTISITSNLKKLRIRL